MYSNQIQIFINVYYRHIHYRLSDEREFLKVDNKLLLC